MIRLIIMTSVKNFLYPRSRAMALVGPHYDHLCQQIGHQIHSSGAQLLTLLSQLQATYQSKLKFLWT